jgi:hypothetical protein
VTAVALMLKRDAARFSESRERREDVRKLRADVFVQGSQAIRTEPAQILVERVHEHRERQVALEFRRRAGKDEAPVSVGGMRELGEKTRLTDSGLADESDRRRDPPIDFAEHLVEPAELLGAADELVG